MRLALTQNTKLGDGGADASPLSRLDSAPSIALQEAEKKGSGRTPLADLDMRTTLPGEKAATA